jgi:predicted HTH transcriptional regulator
VKEKIDLLVKSYYRKGDRKADLLISELLVLFDNESNRLEKLVMQKIAEDEKMLLAEKYAKFANRNKKFDSKLDEEIALNCNKIEFLIIIQWLEKESNFSE